MHARRLSCLLLGLWLAGSMATTFIAADSEHTANRILLDHPAAASLLIKDMGQDQARLVLDYPVTQQARWWLMDWANLELVLGAAFFFFLLFGTREGKVVLGFTLGMYALVLFERFLTLPEILYLGAQMVLVPVNVVTSDRNQLTVAQNVFIGLEIFKVLVGFGMAVYFIARSHRSNHARD